MRLVDDRAIAQFIAPMDLSALANMNVAILNRGPAITASIVDVPGVRPAVITTAQQQHLIDYLRFRHLLRI